MSEDNLYRPQGDRLARSHSVGLSDDGAKIAALTDVEQEFGIRLDYSGANEWGTVGDVYSALLAELSLEEAAKPETWDRFTKAISRVTGTPPSRVMLESGLVAEDGGWVPVADGRHLIWYVGTAIASMLIAWLIKG